MDIIGRVAFAVNVKGWERTLTTRLKSREFGNRSAKNSVAKASNVDVSSNEVLSLQNNPSCTGLELLRAT